MEEVNLRPSSTWGRGMRVNVQLEKRQRNGQGRHAEWMSRKDGQIEVERDQNGMGTSGKTKFRACSQQRYSGLAGR